jgi:hypothetical protein
MNGLKPLEMNGLKPLEMNGLKPLEMNGFSYAEIKIDNVINLLIHVTTHSKIFEKSYLCK